LDLILTFITLHIKAKMRWEKLSEPIRKLGEWFFNVGLATYVAVILQPLVKGTEKVSWLFSLLLG
jgi:uncharacterized protein (DUF2164 family)